MSIERIFLSMVVCCVIPALPSAAVDIYFNDFEGAGPVGPEWSAPSADLTPGTVSHPVDRFLGQFGNEAVTLTLNDLPAAHTEVTVSFDLFVIRSWDGNGKYGQGPDFWAVDEGPVPQVPEDWDFVTTFSNWSGDDNQCFPDPWDLGDHPPRTGALENDTLGFLYDPAVGDPYIQDSVYHRSVSIPHTGDTLTISFGALGLQELSDESWGLNDVRVEVDVPEPATAFLLVLGGATALRRFRRSSVRR